MNTLSWSIAMAASIYSVNLPAAENPVPGEKAIVVETRADVAGPKSAPLAAGRPREAKGLPVGPEQFEIEFVGEASLRRRIRSRRPRPESRRKSMKSSSFSRQMPLRAIAFGLDSQPIRSPLSSEKN